MNKDNKTALYTSPEVGVIEVKARQVICGSGRINGLSYEEDESEWETY